MKIYQEISLEDFEAWSGGLDTLNRVINAGKVDELDSLLSMEYPEGIDETELNDLLWFEDEWIYQTLGIRTESELREEMEELHDELNEIMEDFEEESESMTEEEKELLWNNNPNYGMNYETIQAQIKELEEELDNI